ncbi:MAG: RidA family protein [Myxococcales bacterium]|nr:RidA family protein [Myxococcales bacterium]
MSKRKIIVAERAPRAIGPYSQAVQAGDFLFVSGQIPLDPATGELVHADSIEGQTRQVLENIRQILASAGMNFANVVKSTIFLKDLNNFAQVNAVYEGVFNESLPARATIEVSGLPKGADIEIEVVACASS